jgi:hypothetical protein
MWSDKITTGKATTLTLPAGQTCHTQFSRGAVNTRVPEPGSSGR